MNRMNDAHHMQSGIAVKRALVFFASFCVTAMIAACGGGGGSSGGVTSPTAPAGVFANVSSLKVRVHWNAVTGASSYNVYFSALSSLPLKSHIGNVTKIGGVFGTATSVVTTQNTWYFTVTAENSAGESPESSRVAASTVNPGPPPPPSP